MKNVSTLSLKMFQIVPKIKMSKIKNNNDDRKDSSMKDNVVKLDNQKNTPNKEIRRGIGMTDEQKELAQKIRDDISALYKEGYSIRMISNHYNDLYSIRNSQGHILKEAISRETVRKILNNEDVSLKTIIGIIGSTNS
jgi:hypothetical protein